MSGILDKKTRILDSIVTFSGRQQIAAGKLKIEYVSFTDIHTFYEADMVSGSSDAHSRIFFEAANLPQDQITFESDDSGFMLPFRGGEVNAINGRVLSGSSGNKIVSAVTGTSEFNSSITTLLSSSIKNFEKNDIIGTIDYFLEHNKFELSDNDFKFTITDDMPFNPGAMTKTKIENVESLIEDKRLANSANFLFLPPINKTSREPLGTYRRIGQKDYEDYEELTREFKNKEKMTVTFPKTSITNNLLCQFFESGQRSFKKLDVIEYGTFITGDPERPEKEVFFVGKVFPDAKGSYTFVNIFTLVFE